MSLLRRRPKVNRHAWPCDYTGPGNHWGLRTDTPCRIVGKRAGGVRIMVPGGQIWTVARQQVQRNADAP